MNKRRLARSDFTHLGVLMALCLALGVYLIATTVLISKDGVFYIGQAQGFARDPLGVAQKHPPGYPALLWIAHETASLFSGNDSIFSWIHVSQSVTLLCRMLALIPLYFLGKSLIGGARAFWAILILIVLPYPAQYGSDVLRDWPYVMFLSLGLWLLYWAVRRRAWWMFALVGLDAAVGYLIQPAAAQLVLYGLLGLVVALRGDTQSCVSAGGLSWLRSSGAAVLLVAGLAVPVLPYTRATGTFVPHQLRAATFNSAPVIAAVGGRGASREPLEFEARAGELLEIPVEASDAQGDDLTFSLTAVPVGSRPVCQFRLTADEALFATISEEEKNTLLRMFSPTIRKYDGIVYYAYAQGDVRANLEPVHRFWSPSRQRHFYTMRSSEKDLIQAESPKDIWTYEGVAFYAFAEGRQPPDAVPVHRLWSQQAGYSWAVKIGTVPNNDGVAWYAHVAGVPPAGMSVEGRTLRWRPGPNQRGEHAINIVVSDGRMEAWQLVKVTVHEGPAGAAHDRHAYASAGPVPLQSMTLMAVQRAHLHRLPEAVDRLFDGFAESLMVFFLVPWGLGLYHRMRHEADRLEQVLTTAIIVVNAGLILSRFVWVAPSMERRYCLPLVALTIFYVPVGLERMAHWLSRVIHSGDKLTDGRARRVTIWFHILAVIGIAICLPKLLTPLYADKAGYLTAIQWLRDNTRPEDVIATPDNRLTFYAQRPGLICRNEVDPRRADYIVRILDSDVPAMPPDGWSREYSVPMHDRRDRMVVIYKTHR